MIKITIKIPTITDFCIWCNKKASDNDKENLKRINDVKENIIWSINREPIPQENKDYLREIVTDAFRNLCLKRCVWPIKKK